MKLRNLVAVLGLAGGLLLAGQVQAVFLIDDFGALTVPPGQGIDPDTGDNNSYVARDTSVNAPPKYDGVTFFNNMMVPLGVSDNPNNWDREIGSSLVSGDGVQTEICYNCQAGHLVSDAAITPSLGNFFFEWTGGTPVDLNGDFMFDWGADLAGATWSVTIGGTTFDGGSLPAAAGLSHTASVALPQFNNVNSIRLAFNGVDNLDANIDNVRVPEPSMLALLSVGLLGLGWQRRRRAG